jgi:diguanylate cyclase (GGDEF)-like protein
MPSKRVLLIDDSRSLARYIASGIEDRLGLSVVLAHSAHEAGQALMGGNSDFLLGVADMVLPDAPGGEILDMLSSVGLPAIAITGSLDRDVRNKAKQGNVADYIPKGHSSSINEIIESVARIQANQSTRVLVADDSRASREYIVRLLTTRRFKVRAVENGLEALEAVKEKPNLSLVITDYQMPGMDGAELIRELRKTFSKRELAIIGISGHDSEELTAMLLKCGANDFIKKPFLAEEFYCRVEQNVEMLEHIREIQKSARIDFLTGVANRQHFFERGEKIFAEAVTGDKLLCLAMLDIDHFKKINDTYGHAAGDIVLKRISAFLKERFREEDVVARVGGEEFCMLGAYSSPRRIETAFEQVRKRIESFSIPVGGAELQVTASIGVFYGSADSLDEMMRRADKLLYEAKESGRNKTVFGA